MYYIVSYEYLGYSVLDSRFADPVAKNRKKKIHIFNEILKEIFAQKHKQREKKERTPK